MTTPTTITNTITTTVASRNALAQYQHQAAQEELERREAVEARVRAAL